MQTKRSGPRTFKHLLRLLKRHMPFDWAQTPPKASLHLGGAHWAEAKAAKLVRRTAVRKTTPEVRAMFAPFLLLVTSLSAAASLAFVSGRLCYVLESESEIWLLNLNFRLLPHCQVVVRTQLF